MTEYEYHELINGIGSMITELTALFVSVFVAYLICSYTVGGKLSRFQFLAISFTYSTLAFLIILIVYNNLSRSSQLAESYFQIEASQGSLLLLGPFVMGVAWLISIVFMLQTRKEPRSKS